MPRVDISAAPVQMVGHNRIHYLSHLAPIWAALPDDIRGECHIAEADRENAEYFGIANLRVHKSRKQIIAHLRNRPERRVTIVAGYSDLRHINKLGLPNIFVMHGTGFIHDADADISSYPGATRNRDNTVLILSNGPVITAIERKKNPGIRVETVGCPKLDRWINRPKAQSKKPVIALAWHWRCGRGGNTDTLFDEYREVLPELAKHYKLLGHGHPHIIDELIPIYEDLGIEHTRYLEDVFDRADLMIADATSAIYEFAALDRPVVPLWGSKYSETNFGGLNDCRMDLGSPCWKPDELIPAVERALKNLKAVTAKRHKTVAKAYANLDGTATAAAIKAIVEVVEELGELPPAPKPKPCAPKRRQQFARLRGLTYRRHAR